MNKHNKVGEALPQHNNPYLQYLGTFPQLTARPTHYGQLDNGITLTQLFLLIKGFQLTSNPQYQPRTFSHKFTNIKILLQSIQLYWNSELQSQLECSEIDVVEMCHTGSSSELDKLLSLFVRTAAQAQNRFFFIEKILETSQQTQQFLKQIIEKTMQPLMQSPRKQKEKRMIDRLLQLDHENQRLQQIINTICEEKQQLESRLKTSGEILTQQSQQLQLLRAYLNQQTFTPQKRRMPLLSDTSERKDCQIDSLHMQLRQAHQHHQRQMQECLNQLQALSVKSQSYDKVKAELELAQSIIMSNQELIREAQDIETNLSQAKAELMNKENKILVMRQKLDRQEWHCSQMDRDRIQMKSELERKNHQLLQMAAKIERSSPRKVDNHHNLFLEFPEIANTEANAYIETNKALREELQRSREALQSLSGELDQARTELQPLRRSQQENNKLRHMLIEEKAYKGEQIDMLVHALYNLRKKVMQITQQQRPLRNKNS